MGFVLMAGILVLLGILAKFSMVIIVIIMMVAIALSLDSWSN